MRVCGLRYATGSPGTVALTVTVIGIATGGGRGLAPPPLVAAVVVALPRRPMWSPRPTTLVRCLLVDLSTCALAACGPWQWRACV